MVGIIVSRVTRVSTVALLIMVAFTTAFGGVSAGVMDEIALVHSSEASANDYLGQSVGISGDTLVAGAYEEDGGAFDPVGGAGAAYVFYRDGDGENSWDEAAILRAETPETNGHFGYSAAIDGDIIAIGAWQIQSSSDNSWAGSVFIFERNQGGADNWGLVKELKGKDTEGWDKFGNAIALSGNTLVVGAFYEDGGIGDTTSDQGAAYVFERNLGGADNWGEAARLNASDGQTGDQFGKSVAIHGDIVVVGADWEDGGAGDPLDRVGAAYVYYRHEGGSHTWGEVDKLTASDAQADDHFGTSVAVHGSTIAVGAIKDDGGAGDPVANAGAVYIYDMNLGGADAWGERTILYASDPGETDFFGWRVCLDGGLLAVSAYREHGGDGDPYFASGTLYLFERNNGGADTWGQVDRLRTADPNNGDNLGWSMDLDGETLVAGAWWEDGGEGDPISNAGGAYIFERSDRDYEETTLVNAMDGGDGDQFGRTVDLDGDIMVVGAWREDGGDGNPLSNAGAAYVFYRNQDGPDVWGQVVKLTASDAQVDDNYGMKVAVSGTTIAIAAPGEDGGGGDPNDMSSAVYIYEQNEGGLDNWGEVTIIHPTTSSVSDTFSYDIDLDGDTLVIGANGVGSQGWVYIHQRNHTGDDAWGQVAAIQSSEIQNFDQFGYRVAIDGDVLAVTARAEDGGPGDGKTNAGAAYVYYRNEGGTNAWGEVDIIRAVDSQANDYFGDGLALHNDIIAVGAGGEDGGVADPTSASGAVYLYERNTGGADAWGTIQVIRPSDGATNDYFGYYPSLQQDTLAVVTWGGSSDPVQYGGSVYIYDRNLGGVENWGEKAIIQPEDMDDYDEMKWGALSGDTLVVGAIGEDGGVGNPVDDQGGVWVFDLIGNNVIPSITTTPATTVLEDTEYVVDFDAVDPEDHAITWSLVTNASWLSMNVTSGILNGTADNAGVGVFYVNVTVTDEKGGFNYTNYTLTVTNVAPNPTGTPDASVLEMVDYSHTFTSDENNVGMVTWDVDTDAVWLDWDFENFLIDGEPENEDVGLWYVNATVNDGNGGLGYQNFTIEVINVAPEIDPDWGYNETDEDDEYEIGIDTDHDRDQVTMTIVTDADWLEWDGEYHEFYGEPTNDDVGDFTVNITADDGNGGISYLEYTLHVFNEDPDLDFGWGSGDENYPWDFEISSGDEGDRAVGWSIVTNASWIVNDTAVGWVNGTPRNDDVGWYYVNISFDDGNGGVRWQNETVWVYNNQPEILTEGIEEVYEDDMYQLDFNSSEDPYTNITWTMHPTDTFLSINASTGVISGTPDHMDIGHFDVTIWVDDGNGGTNFMEYRLYIENSPPAVTIVDVLDAPEDQLYNVTYASDDDVFNVTTWSVNTIPDWLTFNTTSLVLNGTPDNTHVGSHTVSLHIEDDLGGATDHTITVNVTNVLPAITGTDVVDATEDMVYMASYDSDDDGLGSLVWSLDTDAAWLTIDTVTGNLSGTPDNTDVGEVNVTVRVNDTHGMVGHTFLLTVANTAPTLIPYVVDNATEDAVFTMDFASDDDDHGAMVWSLDTLATWLTIDTGNGTITGTPTNDDVGAVAVSVAVEDGNGGADAATFNLTVINVDPVILTATIMNATEDVAYTATIESDEGPLQGTWAMAGAAWLTMNATTGNLTGTATNDDVGAYTLNVTYDDGHGGMAWAEYDVTVVGVNDGPTMPTFTLPNGTDGTLFNVTFVAEDQDTASTAFVWTIESNAQWLTIDETTGMVSGTPGEGDGGTFWIHLTVSDGELTVTRNVSFTVTVIPKVPAYSGQNATENETVEGDGFLLNWTPVVKADWYLIYADGVLIANVTNTSHLLEDLEPGTYIYTIFAGNLNGTATAGQTFTVILEARSNPAEDEPISPMWFLIILMLILVILVQQLQSRKK